MTLANSSFVICPQHGTTRQKFYLVCPHVKDAAIPSEMVPIGMADKNPQPVVYCADCDPKAWSGNNPAEGSGFFPMCKRCFEERAKPGK